MRCKKILDKTPLRKTVFIDTFYPQLTTIFQKKLNKVKDKIGNKKSCDYDKNAQLCIK